jgi:hypothetical protein
MVDPSMYLFSRWAGVQVEEVRHGRRLRENDQIIPGWTRLNYMGDVRPTRWPEAAQP